MDEGRLPFAVFLDYRDAPAVAHGDRPAAFQRVGVLGGSVANAGVFVDEPRQDVRSGFGFNSGNKRIRRVECPIEELLELRLVGDDGLVHRGKHKLFCETRGQRLAVLIINGGDGLVTQLTQGGVVRLAIGFRGTEVRGGDGLIADQKSQQG